MFYLEEIQISPGLCLCVKDTYNKQDPDGMDIMQFGTKIYIKLNDCNVMDSVALSSDSSLKQKK